MTENRPATIDTHQMPRLRPDDCNPRTRLNRATPVERVLYRTALMPNGCWIWRGTTNGEGYGYVRVGATMIGVHRVTYEALVGPIPDGLHLDHVKDRGCTSTLCVNPAHLEPVTNAENLRRGKGNQYRGRTHCAHGHEFTEQNTHWRGTGRVCRACRNNRKAAA